MAGRDPSPASEPGELSPATLAITAGRPRRRPDEPLNEPVTFASTFHAGGPVAYGRDGNPTWTAFEQALGALEGGSALAFASGMAATTAILDEVPLGGVIVAPRHAYYGTRNLLAVAPDGRWSVRLVDIADTAATLRACDGADLLFVESPTNPMLEVADLEALCVGAHERGALAAVDNTFATPLGQRPLVHGADVVVHSVTKFLAGHADVILGATVTHEGRPDLHQRLRRRRSSHGAIPGPMEVFLALRGLRTLVLRYERAEANAAELARRLHEHDAVERVRYPGLPTDEWHDRAELQMKGPGFMVAVEVLGGAAAAEAVARSVRLIVHATSLGGIETTIERRARWPGEETTPGSLLRLSVGCEDVDDLWRDLEHALTIGAFAAVPGATPVALAGLEAPRPEPGEEPHCPMESFRPR
jgi:cystathionine gamma-synthase